MKLADLFAAAGVAAGLYGLHEIYPPLAWLAAGCLLLLLSLANFKTPPNEPPKT